MSFTSQISRFGPLEPPTLSTLTGWIFQKTLPLIKAKSSPPPGPSRVPPDSTYPEGSSPSSLLRNIFLLEPRAFRPLLTCLALLSLLIGWTRGRLCAETLHSAAVPKMEIREAPLTPPSPPIPPVSEECYLIKISFSFPVGHHPYIFSALRNEILRQACSFPETFCTWTLLIVEY